MSRTERDVLKVMSLVLCGKRTQVEAGRLLLRSSRQIRRLQRRMESEGDCGVVHKLRGQTSNRRLKDETRAKILSLGRGRYAGFGPTLLQEKLADHGLCISVESVRGLMLKEGLWQRKRRREKHRMRRQRRECFGEMVLADASEHDWFSTGERLTLVGMIDDATGRILVRFFPSETTAAYMEVLRGWIDRHGRPLSWYTDRHGIFRAESRVAGEDEPVSVPTQFSRALSDLGIELILANSPQAKGRIERLWGTLQDRWVKEFKSLGIKTIEAANAQVDRLSEAFNRKFGKEPASKNNAHKSLDKTMDPAAIFSHQEQRRVSNDYTIQFQTVTYQLLMPVWPGERGGIVTVQKRLDGSMKVWFKKRYLEFTPLEEQVQAKPQVQAKLHEVLKPQAAADVASLSLRPKPAVGGKKSKVEKKTNEAIDKSTASPAVHRTGGRSGRTPALPCPSAGKNCGSSNNAWRPAPAHPWRRSAVA